MNLDDPKLFETAPQKEVLAEIDALPDSLLEGINTDFVDARGAGLLAQLWSLTPREYLKSSKPVG